MPRPAHAWIWVVACIAATGISWATEPEQASRIDPSDHADVGSLNEEYLRVAERGSLQSEIVYLKPDAPFVPSPDARTEVPDPPLEPDAARERSRWIVGLVFGGLLIAILFVFARFGTRISVSFSEERDGARQALRADKSQEGSAAASETGLDPFLARLQAMSDRREALVLLVSRTIEQAAAQNDLRLGRSLTARDVLRILPGGWAHLPALRRLVRQVEIVHFGGRDLSDADWRACWQDAVAILGLSDVSSDPAGTGS